MKSLLSAAVLIIAATSTAMASEPRPTSWACDNLPPASARLQPMDPYQVAYVPSGKLQRYCGPQYVQQLFACERENTNRRGTFLIFIDSGLPSAARACMLIYEKAHLPPNNWRDEEHERWLRASR